MKRKILIFLPEKILNKSSFVLLNFWIIFFRIRWSEVRLCARDFHISEIEYNEAEGRSSPAGRAILISKTKQKTFFLLPEYFPKRKFNLIIKNPFRFYSFLIRLIPHPGFHFLVPKVMKWERAFLWYLEKKKRILLQTKYGDANFSEGDDEFFGWNFQNGFGLDTTLRATDDRFPQIKIFSSRNFRWNLKCWIFAGISI